MSNRVWILGAPDPEMELIERLLRDAGEEIAYAADGEGRRVDHGTAYRATLPSVEPGTRAYLVECDGIRPEGADVVVIDHHRPGDPGYGRPPAEFLPASSIGQVISELARLGETRDTCPLGRLGWRCYQGDTPRLGRGDWSYHQECYGWQQPSLDEPMRWWIGAWPWQSPRSAGIARVAVPDEYVVAALRERLVERAEP